MKKIKVLFTLLAVGAYLSVNAWDFCKNNPSQNDKACEIQCPGQVECSGPGNECYGHGNNTLTRPGC